MKMGQIAAMAAVLIAAPAATFAGEVIVTPSTTSWGTIPGENTGGGTTVITTTVPQSGDGSLELRGDRTRYQMGVQYGGLTNLGSAKDVVGLSFDWRIAGDSTTGYNKDYTPALRLLVQDGNQSSELVWEGVYNGTYGNTTRDTWYSSSFSDLFYQKIGGVLTLSGTSQLNQTLATWIAGYSSNAYISAISVGAGSGASTGYHAFVDNVTLGKMIGSTLDKTIYNFEVSGNAGAVVPEPATWAAMLMGFGALGVAARRRRGAKASA